MSSDLSVHSDRVVGSLGDRLTQYKTQQFTGRANCSVGGSLQGRSLYFCLGRLFWAADHRSDNRRLTRLLAAICPDLKQRKFALRQGDAFESQNYNLLVVLLHRKTLSQSQFCQIVSTVLAEVLFDLLQETGNISPPSLHHPPSQWVETPYSPLEILKIASTPVSGDRALAVAEQEWQAWKAAKLEAFAPSAGLLLRDGEALQAKLPGEIYQKLVAAMDGRRSLRDLAGLMQKDAVVVLKSLASYITKGAIELIDLPDLAELVVMPTETAGAPAAKDSDRRHLPPLPPSAPTIACIDDSPQICALMEQTIAQAGYRPLCIQDSTKALPQLLEHKPSVIFLDLIMPVANGYEICTQIRRIALFKDTPVAILTGSDGIVDRVRAKVAGATDFITKPIDPEKIQGVLKRYLESNDGATRLSPSPVELRTN